MSTSGLDAMQQRCQQIVTSPVLTPEQKRHFLALEAESNLPYPGLPHAARSALDDGFICDMFEGHAPFKRATFCLTTPNFWPTGQNGWSSKAQKILMTRFRY